MARARGKIGMLPHEERVRINRMLRDNAPYSEIQALYAELTGCLPDALLQQNISAYKAATYQGWLRNQERIERMRERREFAKEIFEAEGEDLSMASNRAARVALDHLEEVLDEFDPESLRVLLAEKPDKFFSLIESLAALRKGDQQFAALKMQFERHRAAMRDIAAEAQRKAAESGSADLAALADRMQRVLMG